MFSHSCFARADKTDTRARAAGECNVRCSKVSSNRDAWSEHSQGALEISELGPLARTQHKSRELGFRGRRLSQDQKPPFFWHTPHFRKVRHEFEAAGTDHMSGEALSQGQAQISLMAQHFRKARGRFRGSTFARSGADFVAVSLDR